MEKKIFRTEALLASRLRTYGSTCRIHAFSHAHFAWGLCFFVPLVLIFIFMTHYSEQHSVRGYLDADQGIVSVYPIESGTIHKTYIQSEQNTQKGDKILCVNTQNDHLRQHEQKKLSSQLTQTRHRLELALKHKRQYLLSLKPLLEKKYISQATYQDAQNDILNTEQTLHETQRTLAENKHAYHYFIHAPVSGLVSNFSLKVGQQIQPDKSILDIIPKHNQFIVQLAIPASQIGYVHAKDSITLRYDAYPDQTTALMTGQIQTITQTISTETDNRYRQTYTEPYYKAIATLPQQYVLVAGVKYPLHLGMGCSAVIQGARKRIWRWMIDPFTKPYL